MTARAVPQHLLYFFHLSLPEHLGVSEKCNVCIIRSTVDINSLIADLILHSVMPEASTKIDNRHEY